MPESPNVLHLYSQIVAESIEQFEFNDKEVITNAKNFIDKGIILTQGKYSKYYATRSRINTELNNFDQAKEDVRLAIETESSASIDYPIRIGEYQNIQIRINYLQNVKKLLDKQDDVIRTFDQLRLQVIQILGILTAVISFIVTSVQISKNFVLSDAYKLIIVTSGMCLLLFSCFSMLFFNGKIRNEQWGIAIFSIVLIVLAMVFLNS